MARIALIHALVHSIAPINAAFDRDWPQAERMNLLDDSLSADLARGGAGLDAAMHQRFQCLAVYAVDQGAQGVLFTCSAFGPCIEAVAQAYPYMPVLKPNEAMVSEAVAALSLGGRLGLMATFEPTLQSMPREFPRGFPLALCHVPGALEALNQGQLDVHDALVAAAAVDLKQRGCTHLALAQFSMARARDACHAASGLPVLTTVDSAVSELRQRLS